MIKHNQDGAVNGVVVSLVLCILLLVGALAFAGWAYSSRQDYKQHTDAKVSVAVDKAKQAESAAKDAAFVEAEKNPLRTYNGPEAYGSLVLQYPKTWSGYVDDSGSSNSAMVDGYFYPGVVPSLTNQSSVFALRVQVLNQAYASVVKNLSSSGQQNPPTITAYSLPKLPKVVGVKITGTIGNQGSSTPKQGIMVVLPLRSQTVQIWTEGNQFINDFNNSILPNFSFSP